MKQTSLGGARQRTAKGGMAMMGLEYHNLLCAIFGGGAVVLFAFILIVLLTAGI
jgi:hypothetical protein